jgi:integrase
LGCAWLVTGVLPVASIRTRQLKDGTFRYDVLFRMDGRQTSETFPNLDAASRFNHHIAAIGAAGAVEALFPASPSSAPAEQITIGGYLDRYIENLTGITDGTRSDYHAYRRRRMELLVDVPVAYLTRDQVAQWVNSLSRGPRPLSGKSIKNTHALLSAAMTRAARDGLIPGNPCRGIRLPRSIRREMTFLTAKEFAQLLAALDEFWHPLVITLAGTGLRWGEATALAVRDLDLDGPSPAVRVRQAWKHTDGRGRELGAPKTNRSVRTVTVSPQVATLLREQAAGKKLNDFVFLNRQRRPIWGPTFYEHGWRQAVAALEKDMRVHDLRHTHVAWLIARDVSLPMIQNRLGHESISTTVDTYGHLAAELTKQAAAAADDALTEALGVDC